jgi:hypothetical protein
MGVVAVIYRLIDEAAHITPKLVAKFPVLKKKKYTIQVFGTAGVVLVLAVASMLIDLPHEIFYVLAGSIAGFVNGVTTSIISND